MIVLAGRNLAKMEAAKAELDELGVESYLCKTDIADRAQVQALAEFAASLGDVTQVIHTSGVSPSDTATENIIRINAVGTVNMVEAFYPVLAEGGVMINFSSVAAYTMPQTDEWSQAFEAWNEPDFYDRLLAMAGEAEDEEGEFFRAGLAYAMSKKFVIYFTQKMWRASRKSTAAYCPSRPAVISRPCTRSSSTISRRRRRTSWS